MLKYTLENEMLPEFANAKGGSDRSSSDDENQVFYTVGSEELRDARMDFLNFSIPRAQERLKANRPANCEGYEHFVNSLGPFSLKESQYADDRCVSRGVLSPSEELFATAGWSGNC